MPPFYHKILLVERVVLNALDTRLRRLMSARLPGAVGRKRSSKICKIFPFISRFRYVEDGPGGIYLSGLPPNPARHRHLRVDPSICRSGPFSDKRAGHFGQSRTASIWESSRAEKCAASGKTGDLGG
jgi:hypothetical protein